MPKFRHQLTEILGQDPAEFLNSSDASATSDQVRQLVEQSLALIDKSEQKLQNRKKLSRQIGAAKRSGEPTEPIIQQVAGISQEIEALDQSANENILALARSLATPAAVEEPTAAPQHFLSSPTAATTCAPNETVSIACENPFPSSEWQHYVEQHDKSTAYHDARWRDLISGTFGHQPYYLTARIGGRLAGVLPIIHMSSRLFGSSLISLPYFNYSGVLADSPEIERQLLSFAANLIQQLDASHLEVRDTVAREAPATKRHKVSMILTLPESDQALDNALGSKLRAQVKRAKQNGLTVKHGAADLLDDFYRVFSHNMRDLGTPVYSRRVFENIINAFPDKASLTVVYQNQVPLAAGFLIGHNDKMEIPWASSIRKSNHLGANMYLYRSVLRRSIEANYQFFDFGRSSIGASTHKFKRQWGATEHPLYWHYWLAEGEDLPEVNPQNPKYQLAIKVWQRLPLTVANSIGPMLARNLP